MKQWSRLLDRRDVVARLNTSLFASLTHCPTLEVAGLSFRCVECHVASGTLKKGDDGGWHLHGEYQLEIPLAGSFLFEASSGGKVKLGPGRALLIPMQLPHSWRCLRSGPMIGISLDLLTPPQSVRENGWPANDFELLAFPSLRRHSEEFLENALEAAPASFQPKATASRLFLLLAEIFSCLPPRKRLSSEAGVRSGGDIRGRESVGRVIAHLEQHYTARVRLDELAESIGMSGRHLHRLFLQHVGKSVHDYLLDLRLEHARQLLMEQNRNYLIKEIASRCGFSSPAYFVSSFGKAFGVSPLSYRAKRGGGRRCFTNYLRDDRTPPPAARKAGKARRARR